MRSAQPSLIGQSAITHLLCFIVLSAFLLVTLPTALVQAAGVIYVKPNGTGNGSSWATATTLTPTLIANAPTGTQIWVAAGTYRPSPCAPNCTVADRSATFALKSGVALYGGFAGTETTLDQRSTNLITNSVVLSGDLLGDDGPNQTNNAENSYHVVTSDSVDASAVFDGFIISGGNANNGNICPGYCGGGMLVQNGSPTLINLAFITNTAQLGGGMHIQNSSLILTKIIFSTNVATAGGGLSNLNSSPALSQVLFFNNIGGFGAGGMLNNASSPILSQVRFIGNSGQAGGGMANVANSNPVLNSVTFSNNSSATGGGGIANGKTSSPILTNVLFVGNTAAIGGCIINQENSNPILTNVTMSGNSASNSGGGLYNQDSNLIIHNSIIWNNSAPTSPQILNASSSTPIIAFSLVQGSEDSDGQWVLGLGVDGGGNVDKDPLFVLPFSSALISSWDLHLKSGSPAIDVGKNDFLSANVTIDLDGYPRIVNGKVDMGASERQVIITNTLPPAGTYGSSYQHTFSAISAAPATWTITDGKLPPGLMLSTDGILSGIPTAAGTSDNITVTATTPYGTDTQTFSIVIARVPLTLTIASATKHYGDPNPTFAVVATGLVNGDTPDTLAGILSFRTDATSSSGVGTYSVTPRGSSNNYVITFVPSTLTITPAPLTISADNKTRSLGVANPPLTATYTGFVNDDTSAQLDTPVTLTTTAVASSDVGTYPITVGGATSTNYAITFVNGTLTVTKGSTIYLPIVIRQSK